ncbi:hypothetical protein KSP39_PZI001333 [Platanthera zijinensis]|uniref:Uncharacterized protein n=1 Tax=Platanthera zijinensis TaxID=2320716 RepID=A0AAP0C3G5_9ASPA
MSLTIDVCSLISALYFVAQHCDFVFFLSYKAKYSRLNISIESDFLFQGMDTYSEALVTHVTPHSRASDFLNSNHDMLIKKILLPPLGINRSNHCYKVTPDGRFFVPFGPHDIMFGKRVSMIVFPCFLSWNSLSR